MSDSVLAAGESPSRESALARSAKFSSGDLRLADVLRGDLAKFHRAMRTDPDRANPILRMLVAVRTWAKDSSGPKDGLQAPFCPPFALLWSSLPGDASTASFLHKAYLRELWRERGFAARALLVARIVLIAPWIHLALIAYATRLNGGATKSRSGKPVFRQILEQLEVALSCGILAPWYYGFELQRDELRARVHDYLLRNETKGGAYRLFRRSLRGAQRTSLADKAQFAARCRELGVRTVPVLALALAGEIAFEPANKRALPPEDLFLKPIAGRGGAGADWWHSDGLSSYVNSEGIALSHDQLVAHVKKLSLAQPYLVSQRVRNHPAIADLSRGALCTVRMLTVRDERGGHEAVEAVFRMAIGENTVIDNFHAGGIAANVELSSGTLGPATDLGLRPDCGWRDRHPTTGARIEGRTLPAWRDAIELALHAHAAFDDKVIVGWDVAILEDGPCVIEGNGSPDLDIHQRCRRAPLGRSRLADLLAFHTRAALAAEAAARGDA